MGCGGSKVPEAPEDLDPPIKVVSAAPKQPPALPPAPKDPPPPVDLPAPPAQVTPPGDTVQEVSPLDGLVDEGGSKSLKPKQLAYPAPPADGHSGNLGAPRDAGTNLHKAPSKLAAENVIVYDSGSPEGAMDPSQSSSQAELEAAILEETAALQNAGPDLNSGQEADWAMLVGDVQGAEDSQPSPGKAAGLAGSRATRDPLETLRQGAPLQGAYADSFEELEVLGQGSFGKAIKARWLLTGEIVVVKVINVAVLDEAERKEARNEVDILALLDHPNCTRYYNSFVEDGTLYIVMEFASGGDLQKIINQTIAEKKTMAEERIMFLFTQICLALHHVHKKGILHRDLKTQNIFVGTNDIIKLGDFGISRIMSNEESYASTLVGTPYFLSPEICEGKPYNQKSDIWSLGCVLYEMVALKHAFDGQSLPAVVMKIVRGNYPPLPKHYSQNMHSLMALLLQRQPMNRPTISQILTNSYVRPYVEQYCNHIRYAVGGPSMVQAAVGALADYAEGDKAGAGDKTKAVKRSKTEQGSSRGGQGSGSLTPPSKTVLTDEHKRLVKEAEKDINQQIKQSKADKEKIKTQYQKQKEAERKEALDAQERNWKERERKRKEKERKENEERRKQARLKEKRVAEKEAEKERQHKEEQAQKERHRQRQEEFNKRREADAARKAREKQEHEAKVREVNQRVKKAKHGDDDGEFRASRTEGSEPSSVPPSPNPSDPEARPSLDAPPPAQEPRVPAMAISVDSQYEDGPTPEQQNSDDEGEEAPSPFTSPDPGMLKAWGSRRSYEIMEVLEQVDDLEASESAHSADLRPATSGVDNPPSSAERPSASETIVLSSTNLPQDPPSAPHNTPAPKPPPPEPYAAPAATNEPQLAPRQVDFQETEDAESRTIGNDYNPGERLGNRAGQVKQQLIDALGHRTFNEVYRYIASCHSAGASKNVDPLELERILPADKLKHAMSVHMLIVLEDASKMVRDAD